MSGFAGVMRKSCVSGSAEPPLPNVIVLLTLGNSRAIHAEHHPVASDCDAGLGRDFHVVRLSRAARLPSPGAAKLDAALVGVDGRAWRLCRIG